ncbi:HET-domain-containing protein [Corynespora cassiicola Philippines]|uniref:HET-domain-containing protein n=1 Tax=Corynespora cassiicola Philippines TaxID=1448308 RepID=A0A2T2NHB8_CORCC|nr:HET-domain-containing protein [Corynespora cassiicola Philippines]
MMAGLASLAGRALFEHQPLDLTKRQIRLAKISRQDPKSPIRCDLEIFDLESTPLYIALSYIWGKETPTESLLVNGRSFEIRENLYNFISHFCKGFQDCTRIRYNNFARFTMSKATEIYFWIDQICIDQTNIRERNHQVQQMSHIYSNATCVLSWLGCDQQYVDAVHKFRDTGNLRELELLLSNRYFTRLWVVQEILLAKDLQFACGDIMLPLKRLLATFCSLHLKNTSLTAARFLFADQLQIPYSEDSRNEEAGVTSNSFYKHRLRHLPSLYNCLSKYSECECADPRDKLYGLIGLCGMDDYQADYTKSVQEVFADAIVAVAMEWNNQPLSEFPVELLFDEPLRYRPSSWRVYNGLATRLASNMGLSLSRVQIQNMWNLSKHIPRFPSLHHNGEGSFDLWKVCFYNLVLNMVPPMWNGTCTIGELDEGEEFVPGVISSPKRLPGILYVRKHLGL